MKNRIGIDSIHESKNREVSPFLQATKALRESRGIALLCFLDLDTRRGRGVSHTPRPESKKIHRKINNYSLKDVLERVKVFRSTTKRKSV
jgi:hypothetical protein